MPTVCTGASKAEMAARVSASMGPLPMRPVSMPSEMITTAPRSWPDVRVESSPSASPMRVASAAGAARSPSTVVGISPSPNV